MQILDPSRTTWHITFGTYGARLHGGGRPTVDRRHNARGEPFIGRDGDRAGGERDRMDGAAVRRSAAQRARIESAVPAICERGGWSFRVCAAPPPPENDHVHVLLDADRMRHGKQIRHWLKRWLSEALDEDWARPASGSWWAEAGSTKPVGERRYLNNTFDYIRRQRTTPFV